MRQTPTDIQPPFKIRVLEWSSRKDLSMLSLGRRTFMAALAAGALLLGAGYAWTQSVDSIALYAPGPLGEMALGSADAPVTIVEYASMSCPHCADFSTAVFDQLKTKYIDTGKVRFIFREFPHNDAAYLPAMIARCAPAGRFFEIVDAYFERQGEWLRSADPVQALFEIASEHGFTREAFDACISNRALFTAINEEMARGTSFGVRGTPTFFINGTKFEDAPTLANFEKEIDSLL
jgi:protein-disulfide isomerase